jgi:calcineurin-like phosphoesterase family protein
MLMLHISDIHFKSPECLDPWTDPHSSIRTLMMRDLAERVRVLGDVGAILVGGDIAFKADPAEYETARTWLQQLSQISGCPKERIFVVPGNHDVDRDMIRASIPIQNVQHAVASTAPAQRSVRLRQQLSDETSGQHLLKPHAAYNEFAARFGCQIWPSKPFWHQDIPLQGGVNLRLYGLTSTLLSGKLGNNDAPRDLFLSSMQTVLNPAPNTANLVLVHHPLEWLVDADEVDDALSTRAAFHLFGHKHRQRAVLEANYVRLGAGAVNPSLDEKPYDPGYNLISLEVVGTGAHRVINVELHQRKLQTNPELFVPIKTAKGDDVFRSAISIPEEAAIPGGASVKTIPPVAAGPVNAAVQEDAAIQDAEAAMGQADTRDLLYRFWNLSSSQRRDIAQGLGLLEPGEMKLPEPERYGRALIRAGARNLMDQVAAAVAKLEA